MNLEELKSLDDVVKSAEVKRITGLGRTALDKLDKNGVLNKIYMSERSYVYCRNEVNSYITTCINNPRMAQEKSSIDQARKKLKEKRAKQ